MIRPRPQLIIECIVYCMAWNSCQGVPKALDPLDASPSSLSRPKHRVIATTLLHLSASYLQHAYSPLIRVTGAAECEMSDSPVENLFVTTFWLLPYGYNGSLNIRDGLMGSNDLHASKVTYTFSNPWGKVRYLCPPCSFLPRCISGDRRPRGRPLRTRLPNHGHPS